MSTIVKRLLGLLATVVLLLVGLVYWATYHPADVQSEPVVSPATAPMLRTGQTLRIMSWNVQFMAGNQNNHFFYDEGPDPWPDAVTVRRVTDAVAEFIARYDPDIVLLQEVDDVASRTHRRDQTQALLAVLPQYPAFTETFYWKAAYVPHPAVNGRVGLKLVLLSKYQLKKATRYALPALTDDNLLVRQFNIKRALQQVRLPVTDGEDLIIMNTHLSAFAQGSDTMQRQVSHVMERLDALPTDLPWVLGGDFNLLPNDRAIDAGTGLRRYYNAVGTELKPLIGRYLSVPPLSDIEINPAPWYTYMSPKDPDRRPSRTIDYIFFSPTVSHKGQVLRGDAKQLSDHLPILVEITLP